METNQVTPELKLSEAMHKGMEGKKHSTQEFIAINDALEIEGCDALGAAAIGHYGEMEAFQRFAHHEDSVLRNDLAAAYPILDATGDIVQAFLSNFGLHDNLADTLGEAIVAANDEVEGEVERIANWLAHKGY